MDDHAGCRGTGLQRGGCLALTQGYTGALYGSKEGYGELPGIDGVLGEANDLTV